MNFGLILGKWHKMLNLTRIDFFKVVQVPFNQQV